MNAILFCLIFIQVSIFFIAGTVLGAICIRAFRNRCMEKKGNLWSCQPDPRPAFSRVYVNASGRT